MASSPPFIQLTEPLPPPAKPSLQWQRGPGQGPPAPPPAQPAATPLPSEQPTALLSTPSQLVPALRSPPARSQPRRVH
eukprot:7382005-Prymnesium_polylepis.1